MNRTELAEPIHHGENSGVAFKRDYVTLKKLAREMAALLNPEGGHILLGVEEDRSVSGPTRERGEAEEWVMEAARTHLRPATIPFWETLDWYNGKTVGIVSLSADAPDNPYRCRRGPAWVTEIRADTTSHDATDEEEAPSICNRDACSTIASPSPALAWMTSTCAGCGTTSATRVGNPVPLRTTARHGRASSSTPGSCTNIEDARYPARGAAALRRAAAEVPAPCRNQCGRVHRDRKGLRRQGTRDATRRYRVAVPGTEWRKRKGGGLAGLAADVLGGRHRCRGGGRLARISHQGG